MWDLVVHYRNGTVERFELSDKEAALEKAKFCADSRTTKAIELYGPNGEYDGVEL